MPEYITVTENIERRTYLKGRFTGKFLGFLDQANSDLKHENFYDLEITEAAVSIYKADLRTWTEGDEFEEFIAVEKFLTKLPNPMHCAITYKDGSVKHYDLHINEPKLLNYRLFNRLYEKDRLFATIEGDISGYLKHFDAVEKQIEKKSPPLPLPKATTLPEVSATSATSHKWSLGSQVNASRRWSTGSGRGNSTLAGCAPFAGCSTIPGGCLSLFGIIFVAYLFLTVIAMILSAAASLFSGPVGTLILSFLFSVLIPVFLIGSLLYIFVRLQTNLGPAWKWLFRLVIAFLIFAFLLN